MLIVDDSSFIRRLVADTIRQTSDLFVAGEACDGAEALERMGDANPAVVTLDLEMPGIGGLETLGYIMSESPCPVVVLSAHSARNGDDMVVQALAHGAVDFVHKPSHENALDIDTLQRRILHALRSAVGGRVEALRVAPPRPWRQRRPVPIAVGEKGPPRGVVIVAASTGGPRTLVEFCEGLQVPAGHAVIIAQHMPAGFTGSLARRLAEQCIHPVVESTPGMRLQCGVVVVAAGGWNWVVASEAGAARLEAAPEQRTAVRPEADALLKSAVAVFGASVTAVILTGMGRDGARGAQAVRLAGGRVLVQSPETAVVQGMPRATMALLEPDVVATIPALAAAIHEVCGPSPTSSPRA